MVLVSCLNLLDWFFEWAEFTVAPTIENPIKRVAWILALNNLQNDLAAKNVTWCDFAYEIDGVLTNQASYYTDQYDQIEKNIQAMQLTIVNRLGLEANSTTDSPLMAEFSQTKLMTAFLTSSLIVVVCFLGILSSQLIYSLMLSDVEQKTYEYGMLRALGFKSSHLISMITIQSFFFSIPGVILGISVAFVTNVVLRYFIFSFSRNTADFELSSASLWVGILFGIIMPVLAILLPI